LRVYRQTFPMWASDGTDRGLLNWCHDRSWAHLSVRFDGMTEVSVIDRIPTREFYVRTRYRLRWKKHDLNDMTSAYPTQMVLDFEAQDQAALDGLERVHLTAGYRWDPTSREIADGVLTLRDGRDNVIWAHLLDEPKGGYGVTQVTPIAPSSGPSTPSITMPKRDGDAEDKRRVGS